MPPGWHYSTQRPLHLQALPTSFRPSHAMAQVTRCPRLWTELPGGDVANAVASRGLSPLEHLLGPHPNLEKALHGGSAVSSLWAASSAAGYFRSWGKKRKEATEPLRGVGAAPACSSWMPSWRRPSDKRRKCQDLRQPERRLSPLSGRLGLLLHPLDIELDAPVHALLIPRGLFWKRACFKHQAVGRPCLCFYS